MTEYYRHTTLQLHPPSKKSIFSALCNGDERSEGFASAPRLLGYGCAPISAETTPNLKTETEIRLNSTQTRYWYVGNLVRSNQMSVMTNLENGVTFARLWFVPRLGVRTSYKQSVRQDT